MANKVIQRKDLVAPNAITSITDETKILISELEKLLTTQKDILKGNTFKTSKDIKDYNKVVLESSATTKALVTTRKKLLESQTAEAAELAKVKIQLQEKNKLLKEEAKEELKLISVYSKKSKHLRDLKNDYKDATLAGTKSRKELNKMRKAVIKLDNELVDLDNSVNDSFRNIGKYSKALDKTKKSMVKAAAATTVLGGAYKSIKGGLESTEEGSEDLKVGMGKLDAGVKVASSTFGTALVDLIDFGTAVAKGEKSITEIGGAFEKTAKKIDKFAEDLEASIDASDAAVLSTIALDKAKRTLGQTVAELTSQIDEQNAIAGDTTRGMDSVQKATEKALEFEIKRSAILVKIAEEERDIIADQIKIGGEGIKNADLKNQLAEKEIELIGIKNDSRIFEIEQTKVLAENERDRFEKGLDYALDLFDTQKSLNERGIEDETKTFDERVKLLDRTKVLADEAFAEQIRLAEKQTGESLKLNELVALDDEKLIFARVNAATQDEIVQQRILDIIRDRKTAILDLTDAEKELADFAREANDENSQAFRDFIQEKEDLENAYTDGLLSGEQREINAVRDKYFAIIEMAKKNKEDITTLEAAQQAEIDAIKSKTTEEETEEKEKQRVKDVETIIKGIDSVSDAMTRASEKRLAGFDRETEENATALDRQERRAEQGLENNAAALQAQQDKLEAQKVREQEEQERRQKILAYFNLAAEYAKDDANTAPFKALATIGVMEAVTALFEQGTDQGVEADMSGSKVRNTGKDDYLGRTKSGKAFLFDGREKIMGIQHSAALTDYSNQQIVDIVQNSERGGLTASIALNDSRIVSRLDSLEKAVQNSKVSLHIDENAFVTHTQFTNGMKKVSKSKPKRLF